MKTRDSKGQLNKGFTLIELIVVVAIMIVMAGAAAVTVTMLDSSYVEDAERGIKDYLSLGRTKSMSVAAKDWYISISKEDNDYYVSLYKVVTKNVQVGGVVEEQSETILMEKKKLGAKITITYSLYTTDTEYTMMTVGETNKLEFHFDPSTGKVVNVVYGTTDDSRGVAAGIGRIGIKRNDYDISLKVFYNTGKCERE